MPNDRSDSPDPNPGLVQFRPNDGGNALRVRLEGETVWLTQAQMAELFQTTKQNISLHLRNIYAEGELVPEATVKKYLTVQSEGSRQVERRIDHYSLDAILAVGYRVRSTRGTQFRQWATATLSEYLTKGFVMDDERLKEGRSLGRDYFDELLERIRDIRASDMFMAMKTKRWIGMLLACLTAVSSGCEVSSGNASGTSEVTVIVPDFSHKGESFGRVGRDDFFVDGQLVESIWTFDFEPIMRTRWRSDGYGLTFDFDDDGNLTAIAEADFGTKHGYGIRIDPTGRVVGNAFYRQGKAVEDAGSMPHPKAPEGFERYEFSAREGISGLLARAEEFRTEDLEVVEQRWYDNDDRLVMRLQSHPDGGGHSIMPNADFSIRIVAECRYGLFHGFAINPSTDDEPRFQLWFLGNRYTTPQ